MIRSLNHIYLFIGIFTAKFLVQSRYLMYGARLVAFTWFRIEKFLPLNNNNKKQPAFQIVPLIILPESDEKTVSRRRLKPFPSVAFYPRWLCFVTEDVSPAVFSKSSLSLGGAGSKRRFNTEQLSAFCERVAGGSLSFRRGGCVCAQTQRCTDV